MEPSAKRARVDRDMPQLPPEVWARIREFVPRDRAMSSPTAAAVRGFHGTFWFTDVRGFQECLWFHFPNHDWDVTNMSRAIAGFVRVYEEGRE